MPRLFMVFTAQQMARLAGISTRKLRYWEQTRVFRPAYVEKRERGPFRRIYSFADLVSLRALARLREYVPLDELRRVGEYLHTFGNHPWSGLAVRVYGKHLAFRDPRTGQWMSGERLGQLVFTLEVADIGRESELEARRAMVRSADDHGTITRNRNVMSNAWVIAGTRIPVEAVTSLHLAGMSVAEILAQYPSLVPADIDAAIAHGGQAA